jgi:hypothetical protein
VNFEIAKAIAQLRELLLTVFVLGAAVGSFQSLIAIASGFAEGGFDSAHHIPPYILMNKVRKV